MDSRSDESDDEFFDCDAANDDDASEPTKEYLPWNKPEGRLSKLNDMKLIDSDEYLYVPITQEPVPKTEDQLEDDAEILLKLGPESGKRQILYIEYLVFSQKIYFRKWTKIFIDFLSFTKLNRFWNSFSNRTSNTNNECITIIGYGKF